MPKICEFSGMKIYLYFDDHEPPHIHVRGQHKSRIEIETGEYLELDNPLPKNKERELLKWLNARKADIMEAWDDCRNGIHPYTINPNY